MESLYALNRGLSQLAAAGASGAAPRVFGRNRLAAGSALLSELSKRTSRLAEADEEARPAALISLFSLSRAAELILLAPAPEAAPSPLSPAAPGLRSARASSRRLKQLRAALSGRGAGRAKNLQAHLSTPELLLDLRLEFGGALDDANIAEVVEAALRTLLGLPALSARFGEWGTAPADFYAPVAFSDEASQGKLQQAGLLNEIEAGLCNKPGDFRRLCLLREAAPARGRALAWRLLQQDKLRPAVKGMALSAIADDPGALELLVAASRRGPQLLRRAATYALSFRPEPEALAALGAAAKAKNVHLQRAAFFGLAQRSEPEAEAMVLSQIGLEGPPPQHWQQDPLSFQRLSQAFGRLRQPRALTRLREGAQDASIPEEDAERRRWSRSRWVAALAMCPPSADNSEALCRACARGGAPMEAFWQLARVDLPRAAGLIELSVRNTACELGRRRGALGRRAEDDYAWAYSLSVDWQGEFLQRQISALPERALDRLMALGWEADFLFRLAQSMSPEAFFEALSPSWREDLALRQLMQVDLQQKEQLLSLDARWAQLMLQEGAALELSGIIQPGAPKAAEQLILGALPRADAEETAALLSGLSRLHQGEQAALVELVRAQLLPAEGGAPLKGKLLYRRLKTLEPLLSLLGAPDIPALAGLQELAPAGLLATAVGARLAELRGLPPR